MKRVLSMILTIMLFASSLSVETYAKTETTNIIIECNGEKNYYAVIDTGTDFLFKGEDLEKLTGYSYEIESYDAFFSRGSKKIRVDISKGRLYPMEDITILSHINLEDGIQELDGNYYFSGAYMLPWLNVSCCEEEGILKITTDIASIWELIPQFEPKEFEFDFVKCCEELGKESKYVKAAAYIRDSGISGMFWDIIPYIGESMDYYDLFEDAVLDQSSTKESVDELLNDAKGINYWMEIADDYEVEEYLPDELKIFGAFANVLSSSSTALELALYYTAICEHNDNVLAALYSMELNSSLYGLPDSVVVALVDIRENFSDFNTALSDKLARAVGDGALDTLFDKTTGLFKYALDLVGLAEITSPDWSEGVNRIGLYDVISKYCLDAYLGNSSGTHKDIIRDTRGLAYMYLYACEQNYRSMASYAAELGQVDMQKKYEEIADKAEEWQAKFLSTSLSEENDSHEYGEDAGNKKEQYTKKLLEIFLIVERLKSNVDISVLYLESNQRLLEEVADLSRDFAGEIELKSILHEIVYAKFSSILSEKEYDFADDGYRVMVPEDDINSYIFNVFGLENIIVEYPELITYSNGIYYMPVSDPGDGQQVFEGIELKLDGCYVIINLNNHLGEPYAKCKLKVEQADNDTGFKITSVNSILINSKEYIDMYMNIDKEPIKIELTWDWQRDDEGWSLPVEPIITGMFDDGKSLHCTDNKAYLTPKTGKSINFNPLKIGNSKEEMIVFVERNFSDKPKIIFYLYEYDGIFDLEVSVGGPPYCFWEYILEGSNLEAQVYLPDSEKMIKFDLDNGVYRSYTGAWFWAPFSLDHGELTKYDSSWIDDVEW